MGGDHGPSVIVPASLDALRRDENLRIVLVGLADQVRSLISGSSAQYGERLAFREATQVVLMDEKPRDAVRKKKDSSMRVAIDLVKAGAADACVSAGNTGALMATGRFVLKTIDGIDRPALISRIRARKGHTHMLDLGANSECTPEHLFQFAVMGSVVASDMDSIARPRIGVLNIGEEETKGDGVVQQAAKLLSASKLNYIGFVEGDDIFSGDVDVVVTDGFTGNVALKTMEGLAKMLVNALRAEYTRNPLRYVGAIASWPVTPGATARIRSAQLQRGQHRRTVACGDQESWERRRGVIRQRHPGRTDRGAQGRTRTDRQSAQGTNSIVCAATRNARCTCYTCCP